MACLIAVGLLIGLDTMGDGSGRTVGTSPSTTPRGALDYREFAVGSVAARGADLGLGWHLSYPDIMPNGDGICLAIGTSTTCYHFRDENEMSPVECLPREGGYFVAISRTEVDRVWVEIEDSPTIEARWMPLRAPDGEMRVWLAFLPGSGKGTARIGDSFEQAIRWAPCR